MGVAAATARCFPDFPRGGRRPGGAAAGEGATGAPPRISSPGGGAAFGLAEGDCSFDGSPPPKISSPGGGAALGLVGGDCSFEGSAPPKMSASEGGCWFVFLAGAGIGGFGGAGGRGGRGGKTPRGELETSR